MIKFMEENNWLNADREAIEKVLERFYDLEGNIEYEVALREVIQDWNSCIVNFLNFDKLMLLKQSDISAFFL